MGVNMMYYYRKDDQSPWLLDRSKAKFFDGITYPIDCLPPEFWTENRKPAAETPQIDSRTQTLSQPQDLGDGTVGRVAVDLTAEEIATRREAEGDMVLANAKTHIESQLDPDGMILVDTLYKASAPKGVAVWEWGVAIRKEAYRRRDAIVTGTWSEGDPNDFSTYGNKPHTVRELMDEAGI